MQWKIKNRGIIDCISLIIYLKLINFFLSNHIRNSVISFLDGTRASTFKISCRISFFQLFVSDYFHLGM